ncbi:unnamed protein product, partial [Choristocarpus tenellus]
MSAMCSILRRVRIFRSTTLQISAGCAMCGIWLGTKHPTNQEGVSANNLGAKLARQLEDWLLPEDKVSDVAPTLRKLYEAIRMDLALPAEEQARLPINVLMLKAIHDRRYLCHEGIVSGLETSEGKAYDRNQ